MSEWKERIPLHLLFFNLYPIIECNGKQRHRVNDLFHDSTINLNNQIINLFGNFTQRITPN